jgi:hypothetical protein
MVDTTDLKSVDQYPVVRVQVPPSPSNKNRLKILIFYKKKGAKLISYKE